MTDRRLRIGIDAHVLGMRKTGNERFIAGILPALREACDHDLVAFVTDPAACPLSPDSRTKMRRVPRNRVVRLGAWLPLTARVERLDVLLVQYSAPRAGCAVVTVVHDVSFEVRPENFSPLDRVWMRRLIPAAIRRAAKVVTVSEFSRSEIARVYGLSPERIAVVPDAPTPLPETTDYGPVEPPYFLSLGNIEPRKNLEVLFDAMRMLRARRPDVRERLVVAGQDAYRGAEIRNRAADLVASGDAEFLGYVEDARLAPLIRGATALAYPSVYEGFGLPVIEVMAAGVPAVASDIPVMREVAGDAAVLVPAEDVDGWCRALAQVANDPRLRAQLVTQSRRRPERFSWAESASLLAGALEEAATVQRLGNS